jgi:phage gp16-like protein
MKTPPTAAMNQLKTKIHIAKAELGLDEDRYRSLLVGATGKDSCAEMTLPELDKVYKAMQQAGFVVTVKRRGKASKPTTNAYQAKIFALWFALRDAGACKGDRKSLNAFVKGQTGIQSIDWIARKQEADPVIEALKAWAKREGIELRS